MKKNVTEEELMKEWNELVRILEFRNTIKEKRSIFFRRNLDIHQFEIFISWISGNKIYGIY